MPEEKSELVLEDKKEDTLSESEEKNKIFAESPYNASEAMLEI